MRILHVEDNAVDADLVERALGRSLPDSQIEHVATLADARDYLQKPERFDLALIDLKLPDGSGLDLLGEIQDRGHPFPVVMLTGSGDQNAAIAALHSGADDYVSKDAEAFASLPATLSAARERFVERSHRRARRLHVLYAEHNEADVDLTRRHIARHTPYIRLTVVPDALLALSHLPPDDQHSCDYDVVLLDYRLPGIDALDAVKTIRIERGLQIPIVIVSGHGSEEVAARAMQLGVDDYISKHEGYLYELAPTLEKAHRQHELLREQRALQETSRHLSYMLEASPVVLYTLRLDAGETKATWVSANINRLFGFSQLEALHPGWWIQHLHPDDRDPALAALPTLLEEGRVQHDYRFLDNNGRMLWIRDDLRLLPKGRNGATEALGAWQDITQQKQSEQIQQARISALDGLVGGQRLEQVLNSVVQRIEEIRPDLRVSILLRDPRLDQLYTIAAPSIPEYFSAAIDGQKPEIGCGSCGSAAATGEPVIVDDVQTHPYWTQYRDLAERAGLRACWSIPFKNESGEVLGTFAIYHAEVRAPSEEELHLIGEFARIAGLAVQRADADKTLRQAAAVFASTREGVVITDLVPRIVTVNRAFTEITGYREEEVVGCNPGILQSGRQDESFYQAMWASLLEHGHWQGEIWNRRKNGEVFPQLLTISTVRDNEGVANNYVSVMTDISRIKQSEANLERLAHYDPLTGLPNRLLIQSRLEHAITQAYRENSQVAVLFMDLDRFKNINDSLGHPVGDQLLEALAERFRHRLRDEDTLGRLGGDEFLIVLNHSRRPEDAANVAGELIGLLDEPFALPDQNDVYVGASIGISIFPQDAEDATQLIQHADAAMYQAKEQGRNTYRFYTRALTDAVNQRMGMESRLRRAISNDEFVLQYQPQIDSRSNRIVGCEALLRWNDPVSGLVAPADFIPLAEETGLIIPLGDWVLRTACTQHRAWMDAGFVDLSMSINLSARQLQQSDIVTRVAETIAQHALPADQVKLEITESMIMGRGEKAAELLGAIKSLGVSLSIDDFGTGYSSLAYLKRFPIDELKIDRSFVRDIPDDENDAEIAATIIAMAHNLRLRVVAEGVETREQAEFLSIHGCHYYQGYLFKPPVDADEFEDLLQSSVGKDAG